MSSNPAALEILVVDDDKIVTLLHKNMLRNSGIEWPPVTCKNGLEALKFITGNDQPQKHFLVFLDLNMPVLNGWNFLKKLKTQELQAQVHVVIVTSSINKKDLERSKQFESVIYFCRKPLEKECVKKIMSLQPLQIFSPLQKKAEENE